jgi:hypothetical protein
MPDGSSSAAPVIRPGPSLRRNRVTGFFGPDFSVEEVSGESDAFIFQRIERRCWQGCFAWVSDHPPKTRRSIGTHRKAAIARSAHAHKGSSAASMIWPKGIVFSVRLLDRDQPGVPRRRLRRRAHVYGLVVVGRIRARWRTGYRAALGEHLITAVVRTKDIAPTVRR